MTKNFTVLMRSHNSRTICISSICLIHKTFSGTAASVNIVEAIRLHSEFFASSEPHELTLQSHTYAEDRDSDESTQSDDNAEVIDPQFAPPLSTPSLQSLSSPPISCCGNNCSQILGLKALTEMRSQFSQLKQSKRRELVHVMLMATTPPVSSAPPRCQHHPLTNELANPTRDQDRNTCFSHMPFVKRCFNSLPAVVPLSSVQ
jgi:hypothetical protein